MLYCFINNIHIDYADLLWEGLHYSLEHPSTLIPYPRFTKLIVSHYMSAFPEISRRAHDKYLNLEDDMTVKNIFNSGKNKDGVGFNEEKGIKREYSIARTPQQNGVAERRNRTLIEAARTISKAFRVYNIRTRRVEENLHIGFLENNPMIEGNGPKWLFDIDSLTQSMNYVPVTAGTFSNKSAWGKGKKEGRQDVDNGEPKSVADDQKQDGDGTHNENDEHDKFDDVSSPKEVNVVGQHVNTASPDVNTSSSKLNTIDPSVNTASSYDQDSSNNMFTMGVSHTLEATHVEFFSDEDEPEVDLGNITNSYTVPTTPNTRIHKDHPIKNVIGDVKSYVQTRRMTKPTSKQGFLSAVYEQKTHDTLNTCLYACFLSQIKPTSIAKALSDSSWVEAMQEELLQFKLQ
ncbi:putative ribonuclease H-like domain-containing protein [Tanacetum coccineum]